MMFIRLFLYSLLGVVLAMSGVSAVHTPINFICLLLIVIGIDIASKVEAR